MADDERIITYGIKEYSFFTKKVFETIVEDIFPGRSTNDFEISKIQNHVELIARRLLGEKKKISCLADIIKEAVKDYERSLVSPGDAAGVVSAQVGSQNSTQDVLKSMHSTGKWSSSNPITILSLIRLSSHVNLMKIHILNEQIQKISWMTFLGFREKFLESEREKINKCKKILENMENENYCFINNFFIDNDLEEAKIIYEEEESHKILNLKNMKKYMELTDEQRKSNPIYFNHIETEFNLEKLLISFDEIETAFKNYNVQNKFDFFEFSSSFPLNFRNRFRYWFSEINKKAIKDFLLKEYEEVKMRDLITSSCGECKYTPLLAGENYACDNFVVNLSEYKVDPKSQVYRFYLDPKKLKNSDLTQIDIYRAIFDVVEENPVDIMFVFHNLGKLCFDIVPGMHPDSVVDDFITKILDKKIKGIPGLDTIEEIKLTPIDLIDYIFYDESMDETHIFFEGRNLLYYPINQFKKRVTDLNGNMIKPIRDTLAPENNEVFKIIYKGKVKIQTFPYFYYNFVGKMETDTVLQYTKKYIDRKYFISSKVQHTLQYIGKTSARVINESFYMDLLEASGNVLNYQIISVFFRNIFGTTLSPITPSGHLKNPDVNIMEKLMAQNLEENLRNEIIKGKKYSTRGLMASVFCGKKPEMGTNYFKFIENKNKYIVDAELADAATKQKYEGQYPELTFPILQQTKPYTNFSSNTNFFVNDFEGQ